MCVVHKRQQFELLDWLLNLVVELVVVVHMMHAIQEELLLGVNWCISCCLNWGVNWCLCSRTLNCCLSWCVNWWLCFRTICWCLSLLTTLNWCLGLRSLCWWLSWWLLWGLWTTISSMTYLSAYLAPLSSPTLSQLCRIFVQLPTVKSSLLFRSPWQYPLWWGQDINI